jgi:hypothetical protein
MIEKKTTFEFRIFQVICWIVFGFFRCKILFHLIVISRETFMKKILSFLTLFCGLQSYFLLIFFPKVMKNHKRIRLLATFVFLFFGSVIYSMTKELIINRNIFSLFISADFLLSLFPAIGINCKDESCGAYFYKPYREIDSLNNSL